MSDKALVDLGFTRTKLPAGTHICQIYSDESERADLLLRFLTSGLQADECTACFSEKVSRSDLENSCGMRGVSISAAEERGAFSIRGSSESYFKGGRFDLEAVLGLLVSFHRDSVARGFPNARVIGEMTSEITRVPGGSRLLEYESKVSVLLRTHPVTTVCQYDAHAFDGATIMDVLKVHPMMVVRGAIVHNPFFVPPEEFLA